MQREEKRGEGGGPLEVLGACLGERFGQQPARDLEEQQGVDAMERDVDRVIAGRVHPEDQIIEREAEPGEGMILPEPRRGEHPKQVREPQAAIMRIGRKQQLVVPDEIVEESRKERDERRDGDEPRQPREHRGGLRSLPFRHRDIL